MLSYAKCSIHIWSIYVYFHSSPQANSHSIHCNSLSSCTAMFVFPYRHIVHTHTHISQTKQEWKYSDIYRLSAWRTAGQRRKKNKSTANHHNDKHDDADNRPYGYINNRKYRGKREIKLAILIVRNRDWWSRIVIWIHSAWPKWFNTISDGTDSQSLWELKENMK